MCQMPRKLYMKSDAYARFVGQFRDYYADDYNSQYQVSELRQYCVTN